MSNIKENLNRLIGKPVEIHMYGAGVTINIYKHESHFNLYNYTDSLPVYFEFDVISKVADTYFEFAHVKLSSSSDSNWNNIEHGNSRTIYFDKIVEIENGYGVSIERITDDMNNHVKKRQAHWLMVRKESKEKAYKAAYNDNASFGINFLFSSMGFFAILIGGYILRWFLKFFDINIPSIVIWLLAILWVVFIIIESYSKYKKDIKKADNEYGS